MFREYRPDQGHMFPPSPRDWLPPGHLVWFVSDTVDELDLSELKKTYRKSGKGELAYPVSELTIAGNLKEMFPRITPANDLEFRYGTNAPTLRIEGMTIAGQ